MGHSSVSTMVNGNVTKLHAVFKPVRVFTGSDLITGSDRIGPEIGYLAHF